MNLLSLDIAGDRYTFLDGNTSKKPIITSHILSIINDSLSREVSSTTAKYLVLLKITYAFT